jgi:signal transduction histidine kinase
MPVEEGIIHEIIQPLTSITGYADLMRRRFPEGSLEREYAEMILHEAARLMKIIEEIREKKGSEGK